KLNLGLALHYVLRLYETSEDALIQQGDPADPAVGVYHATGTFQNANLVALLGAKYRHSDEWLFGASLGLPGAPLYSGGNVVAQDVVSVPGTPNQVIIRRIGVNSRTYVPAMARLGAAWIEPQRRTISAQVTRHLASSYYRYSAQATNA